MIPQSNTGVTLPLLSGLDFLTPLWAKKLYDPYNGQNIDLLMMLWDTGAKEAVNETSGEHWEEDRYQSAITVGANVAAPAAGANLVFTLAAGDVDPVTRSSFPIVGNVIRLLNGTSQATYVITTKVDNGTTTTITARPLKGATAVALTAGFKFNIISGTAPEESDQTATQVSFQTAYTWQTQIHRTDSRISGSALTSAVKTTVMQNGRAIEAQSSIQTAQDEYRHLLKQVGTMIWGQSTTNTGLAAFSAGTSSGMVEQMTARAANRQTGGTLGKDDYDALVETLAANFSASNFLSLLSLKSFNEISSDAFSDFSNSNMNAVNNVLSNVLFGQSAFTTDQLSGTYTFHGITTSGVNFALKRLAIFEDPAGAGAVTDGADRDLGFNIPAGKTRVTKSSGEIMTRDYMCIKYKAHNGLNRLLDMWVTGGASPARNTPVDAASVHYLTDMGMDFVNLQQTGLFRR